MTIFLTGATGFVGGVLARQLVGAGHAVRAVVRTPAAAAPLAALGVRLFPGDVTSKDSLRAPMTGADVVLHVAGWYKIGVRDKSSAVPTNVWRRKSPASRRRASRSRPRCCMRWRRAWAFSSVSCRFRPSSPRRDSACWPGRRTSAPVGAREELGWSVRPLRQGLEETLRVLRTDV